LRAATAKLNIAAAVTVGVYLVGWHDGLYPWLADQGLLFTVVLVGLVGAVPLIAWLRRRQLEGLAVWAILGGGEFDPGRYCDPVDETEPPEVTGRPPLDSGATDVTFWACE